MSEDKQQVDFAELERLTNEEEGYVPEQTAEAEQEVEPTQSQTEEKIVTPESTQVAPETPVAAAKMNLI